MLPNIKKITYEEFLKLDENNDEYLEYIDGYVFNQASPSTKHQRISVNLTIEFGNYFRNKDCQVFHAPYDIKLKNDKEEYKNKVIPDLSVICDIGGINDKNYVGVPSLIVEILSPSNESHDLITKMNLYQRFEVKEYWIVNPRLKSIQIYGLNEEGLYEQIGVYKNEDIAESNIFNGLSISLKDLFL